MTRALRWVRHAAVLLLILTGHAAHGCRSDRPPRAHTESTNPPTNLDLEPLETTPSTTGRALMGRKQPTQKLAAIRPFWRTASRVGRWTHVIIDATMRRRHRGCCWKHDQVLSHRSPPTPNPGQARSRIRLYAAGRAVRRRICRHAGVGGPTVEAGQSRLPLPRRQQPGIHSQLRLRRATSHHSVSPLERPLYLDSRRRSLMEQGAPHGSPTGCPSS